MKLNGHTVRRSFSAEELAVISTESERSIGTNDKPPRLSGRREPWGLLWFRDYLAAG